MTARRWLFIVIRICATGLIEVSTLAYSAVRSGIAPVSQRH
jgi:hypothetical protein